MLILSRKLDETIVIDAERGRTPITVRVVAIQGGKVRIGIDAPRDVTVHRSEVFDAIRRAQGDALREIPVQKQPPTR